MHPCRRGITRFGVWFFENMLQQLPSCLRGLKSTELRRQFIVHAKRKGAKAQRILDPALTLARSRHTLNDSVRSECWSLILPASSQTAMPKRRVTCSTARDLHFPGSSIVNPLSFRRARSAAVRSTHALGFAAARWNLSAACLFLFLAETCWCRSPASESASCESTFLSSIFAANTRVLSMRVVASNRSALRQSLLIVRHAEAVVLNQTQQSSLICSVERPAILPPCRRCLALSGVIALLVKNARAVPG